MKLRKEGKEKFIVIESREEWKCIRAIEDALCAQMNSHEEGFASPKLNHGNKWFEDCIVEVLDPLGYGILQGKEK